MERQIKENRESQNGRDKGQRMPYIFHMNIMKIIENVLTLYVLQWTEMSWEKERGKVWNNKRKSKESVPNKRDLGQLACPKV
jgi:hypothetical protein